MRWGVFDSGVGGLTVVRALEEQIPGVSFTYLGDTARVPYGIRSRETVREYASEAARFFASSGVDGLIVACNTASALALDRFEQATPGPVIGVVHPGVQEALAATKTSRVGVIGTPATVRSDAYGSGLRQLSPRVEVISSACPLFVPLAEEGWTTGDVPRLAAERYLQPLIEADVDTVILGCTHYPLLRDVVQSVMGASVKLVDSASAVARAAGEMTNSAGPTEREPTRRFCVTDSGGTFATVAQHFLGHPIQELQTVSLS